MVSLVKRFAYYFVIVLLWLTALFSLKPIEEGTFLGTANFHASIKEPEVELLFVGDIMLDRGVAKRIEANGYESLLKNVEPIFFDVDAVIGNLEGTITNEKSVSRKNSSILRFTFDPDLLAFLKRFNFTVLSSANNHGLDFGKKGYLTTKENLDMAGIASFGSPLNDDDISAKIERNGEIFCFVGYHDLFTFDQSSAVNEIKNIRPDCSFITIFAHWGDEYKPIQNSRQTLLAHEFIDAGADLVIGAHPHVVEPIEIYKNKAIFYSLGNFIFDQDFSFETTHGIAVRVALNSDKTKFTLIPITITKGEVSMTKSEDQGKILEKLIGKSLSNDIISAILDSKEFVLFGNNFSEI